MRILITAAVAACLAVGLAQTATPAAAKDKACKTLKDEGSCSARTDCKWSKPADPKGKCATAPKPKAT